MERISTLLREHIFLWFKIPKQTPVFEAQSPGFGQISSLSIGSVNLITAFSFQSCFLFPFIYEIYTISKGKTGGECRQIIESFDRLKVSLPF